MTTFTAGFSPALNKDGLARLEFVGFEVKQGKKELLDKESGEKMVDPDTGEIIYRDWALVNLNFVAKGLIKGTSQKIAITTNFQYSPDNLLGKVLDKLGYELPGIPKTVDDEGFEVIETAEDEDGFGEVEQPNLFIEEFLNSIVGDVFVGKLYKPSEGDRKRFWHIDVDTLKLLKKAE